MYIYLYSWYGLISVEMTLYHKSMCVSKIEGQLEYQADVNYTEYNIEILGHRNELVLKLLHDLERNYFRIS